MDTTVQLNDDLVREAMQITGAANEREGVEKALKAYVDEHRAPRPKKNMFDLVGKIHLREDYDYKALRAGDVAD